jgi:hypothetical protein
MKALAESNHPTEIAEDLEELHDPQKILKLRQHQGSPSPEQTSLHIEELSAELNSLSAPLVYLQNNIIAAQENWRNWCWGMGDSPGATACPQRQLRSTLVP